MLKAITIKDFKSYREATLPLAPLTILIGANASGKSNAIEAVRMLAWLAHGYRLNELRRELPAGVRGRVTDLPYHTESSFTLGCQLAPDGTPDDPIKGWDNLQITVAVRDADVYLQAEQITGTDQRDRAGELYHTEAEPSEHSVTLRAFYNAFQRGRPPAIPVSDQQAIFTQLMTPARFRDSHTQAQENIPQVTLAYQQMLTQIMFLDPQLAKMRGYSFKVDTQLGSDGSNVSSVLYQLVQDNQEQSILAFIQALPEQQISAITFIETPRQEVMLQLTETFGGQAQVRDAAVLSDGTLRVLAVAAALLTAPVGALVVIEELDNGVHPSRARQLLENIQQVAQARQLRVLLTTHNPALLDALPLSALGDVVYCYRDPTTGASRLTRLAELHRYPALIAQASLGELVTLGTLEQSVKQMISDDEMVARNMAWLHRLQESTRES
ncbi:MAG: AAA family ATPase [Chloroflexaceae bacterium]|nr:AAA family ATPase [Chloroflexaceae bacterium]